jgi:hypothetical protein
MCTTNLFGTQDKYIGLTYQDAQTFGDTNGLQALMNVVDDNNQNIMLAQKGLLLWHP